jgi:hypothetical protein
MNSSLTNNEDPAPTRSARSECMLVYAIDSCDTTVDVRGSPAHWQRSLRNSYHYHMLRPTSLESGEKFSRLEAVSCHPSVLISGRL